MPEAIGYCCARRHGRAPIYYGRFEATNGDDDEGEGFSASAILRHALFSLVDALNRAHHWEDNAQLCMAETQPDGRVSSIRRSMRPCRSAQTFLAKFRRRVEVDGADAWDALGLEAVVHSSIGAASGKRDAYVAAKKARKAQLKQVARPEAYDEAKADLKTLREILDDLDGADGPPAVKRLSARATLVRACRRSARGVAGGRRRVDRRQSHQRLNGQHRALHGGGSEVHGDCGCRQQGRGIRSRAQGRESTAKARVGVV